LSQPTQQVGPNRRRWLSFSLRTLFVLVTLACIYLGWAANWKRQRRAFFDTHKVYPVSQESVGLPTNLPWSLRIVGEIGYYQIYFYGRSTLEDQATLERLFPETLYEYPGVAPVPPAPIAEPAA
jgi:hypothetical protein